WERYVLNVMSGQREAAPVIAVDPETGEVTGTDATGKEIKSPSSTLGLQRVPRELERIAHAMTRGECVALDKHSRAKPLSAPVSAKWFGERSETLAGSVQRRVQYRIDLFDYAEQKAIDKERKRAADLLRAYSIQFGVEGQRWMPNAVRGTFD